MSCGIITYREYKDTCMMMGYQKPPEDNLFIYNVYLESRVREYHPLRQLKALIDFDFVYEKVKETYGIKGNVSVSPPVILKLMLLLILYNVRSEREPMETLPEQLDWLCFLGYTLETPIPDHSVLSKARTGGVTMPSKSSSNGSSSSVCTRDWLMGQRYSWTVAS